MSGSQLMIVLIVLIASVASIIRARHGLGRAGSAAQLPAAADERGGGAVRGFAGGGGAVDAEGQVRRARENP